MKHGMVVMIGAAILGLAGSSVRGGTVPVDSDNDGFADGKESFVPALSARWRF